MNKPILCLDFDGVIHSHTSGWKSVDIISDPPVPGAFEFIREATNHFRVAILSSRSSHPGGIPAMGGWFRKHAIKFDPLFIHWFSLIEWPFEKPSAFVTIDDRALTFDGTWPSIESLKAFKPWNKK